MPVTGPNVVQVTIAISGSLSTAAALGQGTLVGIDVPAIESATLSFQGSIDGSTFREALDNSAVAITLAAGTGDKYLQAPATLAGVPYLKVRTGTSGSPVVQSAARTISLIIK